MTPFRPGLAYPDGVKTTTTAALLAALLGTACLSPRRDPVDPATAPDVTELRETVRETELAFAATMADRDLEAFTAFLDPEAVFFSGATALRGAPAIAAAWKGFFQGEEAPFSWEPDTVEPLATGDLALSSGPVFAPDGSQIGRFNSIWRWDGEAWRIVFDKGEE